ncbi:hypothetical protein CRE_07168 [Caenorhabditis remanei]|uniref:Uncharacterized protein n=1 Tax=Caenorhabditis remanei TaxID=31234 RepID=E3NTE6_CAERE|nr:hypothetical protein CRE_07168 [Caenorhabditis remanei]
MISRMDPKSHDVIVDELDFTSMPGTQSSVQNTRWSVVNLKNAFQPDGPWEFILTNNSRSYLNLKRTYLIFTFDITDTDGNVVTIPARETGKELIYGPINNIAHSIVKNFTLHLNSQLVYHNSDNYAYKAYMENLLMHSKDIKDSTLSAAGFFHEEDVGSEKCDGFVKRCGTGTTQVAANISIDLMNQPRVLLNGCNVKLTVYPNKSEFLIQGYNLGTKKLKFNVRDVYALVNEFDLTDGLSNAIESAVLEHKQIQYPMICSQVRSFYIDSNRYDAPANTLFTTKLPRRLFLGLVSSDAYNGTFGTSPFCFKPYGLSNAYIDVCGMSIPGRPMNLDFKKNKFIEAYVLLHEALGHSRNNFSSCAIDRQMFAEKGYTILGFELSAVATDNSLFDLIKQTNVSVRLEFSDLVPSGGLYCIVYAEFDGLLSMDPLRNPQIDMSV